MGFLSKIFGTKKEDKEISEAFAYINRIIDDENFQNESIGEAKNLLIDQPSFDINPDGKGLFGFDATNPIPVNGPLGEISYLSRLETLKGNRLIFHRLGSINLDYPVGLTKTVDVFEAVAMNENTWFIFYLDFYHPRRSRSLPEGFRFTNDAPQFSGFNKIAPNFPNDFMEMKEGEQKSGLSFAYIPLSKVMPSIDAGMYVRTQSHKDRLSNVLQQLTFPLGLLKNL